MSVKISLILVNLFIIPNNIMNTFLLDVNIVKLNGDINFATFLTCIIIKKLNQDISNMPKLPKRAYRYIQTDHNYKKATL